MGEEETNSPKTIEEYIDRLLETALDSGIKEFDFWEMTIGEIVRAVESNNRLERLKAKEKATFDYIQATLIAKGVSIAFGSKETYPKLYDVYSSVFEDDIAAQQAEMENQKMQLSVLRFKQFAQAHNNKFKSGGANAK